MLYAIELSPNAIEDLKQLDKTRRVAVKKALQTHLANQPTQESKSRIKRLQKLKHPQFRLRVDDVRVFYDVNGETNTVEIIAVMNKEKSIDWLKNLESQS